MPGIFVTVSKLRVVMLVVWLAAVLPWPAYAQERVYRPNIAEEDWSFLKDPSKRRDWWDPVKYIPFERDGWFMTLSGEARFRPEGFRIKATDTSPATRDQYLLQRYLFAADVHLGARTRLFAELQSGLITGKIGGSRPTDRNSADLHQAFLEWRSPRDAGTRFDVRIGRQELTIGSSRLISASPGLNVKRSFDGVRLAVSQKGWRVEAAAAELTELSAGAFDDSSMHEVRFWGVAAGRSAPWANGTWTAYYLGLRNEDMQYAQGRGQDMRHTIGVGVRGSGRLLDFNYDGIWQLGDFEGHEARAWGASTDTFVRLPKAGWRPRFGVRANAASGDRDARDPTLQSFNPLFPGASFAGPIGLFGPTNMIDVTPYVYVSPRRTLVLGFERPWYWRTSAGDGIYNTALRLLVPPRAGTGRFVGGSTGILVVWQATPHIQFSGAIIRLAPGPFLDATFVRDGAGLYSVTALYRF